MYLDFSKASDTVYFDILLWKLSFMRNRNNVHDWLRSFPSHREYFVAIGDGLSTEYESRLMVHIH